ncbi:hypothetical protein EG834_10385, partial [bacterium]|nr:hypothetical protein [bacterium]
MTLAAVVFTLLATGCAPQSATTEPTSAGVTPLPPENTPLPVLPSPTVGDKPVSLHSDKPRETPPLTAYNNMPALSQSNTAFALDLYQQLRSQPGHLFYSPFSISQALA